MRIVAPAISLLLSTASAACMLIDAPEPPGMESTVDEHETTAQLDAGAVLAAIGDGAYRTSAAFTHATKTPYPSAAVSGAWVDEWVSTSSYAVYSQVRPDQLGSSVTLPVGTTVVRVVTDDAGTPTELTLMVKGPAGYNPALGDWWFGVTDPSGKPATTDAGAEMGLLTGCYGCHVPRNGDDYLFGVPVDDRP